MNEHIKQLLKQARSITAENHVPGGTDYEREIYVTFAESIVRECVERIYPQWITKHSHIDPTPLADAVMRVKQHFGAE